jgi:hypothetical protein
VPITEVQRVAGNFVGNGGSVATDPLPAGATAGNLLVIAMGDTAANAGTPTGFTRPTPGTSSAYVMYKVAAGGETSFTITNTGASTVLHVYDVFELEGADPDFPLDVVTANTGAANTDQAGTMPRSTTYDGWALAVWSMNWTAGTTVPTASDHTNGFEELDEHGLSGATNAAGMSVAARPVQSLANWASTVTVTGTTSTIHSVVVVFTAQGARREANIPYFWGFSDELSGYPACHSVSPTNNRYWETQTGSPTIDADGLRLQATATVQQITGNSIGVLASGPKAALTRVRLRINSVTGNLVVASNTAGASNGTLTLRYVSASQKLGLQIGTGTEQVSDQTISTGTWYDVDIREVGTTTAHTADWRINYGAGWVDQPQATFTASGILSAWTASLGWSAASTGDVSYAYAAYSVTPGHYPLGDYTIIFLGPDVAATPTVLGTSSNFRRFTANGTIDGSYDGPAIINALDDWPPTFGASADGLAVVTADASGIRIPMATYNASGTGSIRAGRVVVPIWAASATAATIGIRGYDGTNTTVLFSEADPNADTSSTPPWFAKMWRPTNGWDQAKLDAAALLLLSNDATPDIGPHAVGMEFCVQVAATQTLFGTLATQALDPVTGGVLRATVDTNVTGQAADLYYEESGTPTTVPVAASTTHNENIDAPDMPSTNYIALYPGAEPG